MAKLLDENSLNAIKTYVDQKHQKAATYLFKIDDVENSELFIWYPGHKTVITQGSQFADLYNDLVHGEALFVKIADYTDNRQYYSLNSISYSNGVISFDVGSTVVYLNAQDFDTYGGDCEVIELGD